MEKKTPKVKRKNVSSSTTFVKHTRRKKQRTKNVSTRMSKNVVYPIETYTPKRNKEEEEEGRPRMTKNVEDKNEGLLTNFEMCEMLRERIPSSWSTSDFIEKVALKDKERRDLKKHLMDVQILSKTPLNPQPHEPFETELQCLKELILQGNILQVKGLFKESAEKNVKGILNAIKPIKLTEAEEANLVNMKPKTVQEAKLVIVKDLELNEQEYKDLIKLVHLYLSGE